MSRAIFISSCADPFILLLCVKFFQERFYEEVDKCYINVNNHAQVPKEVVRELLGKLSQDSKIHLIYHPQGIGNGMPVTEMVLLSQEDNILLLEDDGFIYTPGVVDGYFKKIESGETDLLGSPRYSYGEVADAAKKKYNLDYSGIGDRGFGWWPNFFFAKRTDLLKTDLDFGSKKYPKGEYFKELDHTFTEDCYTDTFTWASLQLRYMGLSIEEIPQFHASPTEMEDKRDGKMNWENNKTPSYIHGGSLSTSWNGYLSGKEPDVSNENAVRELETRISWWQICSDVIEGYEEFKKQYKLGIVTLVSKGNLNDKRIKAKYDLYRNLLKI